MRYKIFLLFSFLLFAAVITRAQKGYRDVHSGNGHADTLARDVFSALVDSWALGIDSTSDAVDMRIYNKFKSLFDLNARISDDINPRYVYRYTAKKYQGGYVIDSIPLFFDEYAHDVALKISKLLIDPADTLLIDLSNPANMIFEISRRVYLEKKGRFVLPPADSLASLLAGTRDIEFDRGQTIQSTNLLSDLQKSISKNMDAVYAFAFTDTLRITMYYQDDTVKIKSLENLSKGNPYYHCLNDADNDAILNTADRDSTLAGDFSAAGLPDYDLDSVPDLADKCRDTYGKTTNRGCPESYFLFNNKLDVFVGSQLNSAKINLPELNQLGYKDEAGNDAMDVLQSKKGALKNPGLRPGRYAGGSYTYYLGNKRKRNGVSVGVNYSGFSADYELTDPIVYTFKSFDGADYYRRQVSIDSLKESITYNIFNFPVMYNFRWFFGNAGKKNPSWFNFKIGPSLMLFNTNSEYKGYISFGGLYQTDGTAVVYTDPFNNGSTYNFFLTADSINAQNPNPGADDVFNRLKGLSENYDFASKKQYEGTQKNTTRIAIGWNIGLDLQRQVTEMLGFKLGAHFVYAPIKEANDKYKPIDRTSDPFQSIYNSNAKRTYSAYGFNVGLFYRF